MRKPKANKPSRFAYDGLNRVIHERARLSLLTSLLTHPKGLWFGELKALCALTDGNLNRHLLVLEEAKLVSVVKAMEGNRTQTRCKITALGPSPLPRLPVRTGTGDHGRQRGPRG